MGRILNLVSLCVLFLPLSLAATTIRNRGFPEILNYINHDNINLVVVDLDNTLMATVPDLTGGLWRQALEKKLMKKGLTAIQAKGKVQKIWDYLQTVDEVRPMEKQTAKVIKQIQNSNIKLIGMTSRPPVQAGKTQNQLKSLGLDLSKTALPSKKQQVGNLSGVQYLEGVLYTGSQVPAGTVLEQFFNQVNFTPQVLIYVDDDSNRIQSVFKAVKKLSGIEFIGIHYQGVSKLEQKNTPRLTEAQKKLLNDCLNMPQVQKILQEP